MRVVHVIGVLNRAGTETWLLSLFRELQADPHINNEVLVQLEAGPDGYESEYRELGIPIHLIPRNILWPIRLFRLFRSLSRQDIVHSHRDEFSAVVLLIAWIAGVRKRVAHYHTSPTPTESPFRRVVRRMSGAVLLLTATERIGVSEFARQSLFGSDRSRSKVMYCGVPVESVTFSGVERSRIRKELGLTHDVPLLVHVGGFRHPKNHAFLVDLFAEFRKSQRANAELVLVGDGILRDEIEQKVDRLGLRSATHFLGVRSDVPAILSAADVFVFPSYFEGLGLVAVEALASGLPIVMADTIPEEAAVIPNRVFRRGLSDGLTSWTEAIDSAYQSNFDREVDLSLFARFDIHENAKAIKALYGV